MSAEQNLYGYSSNGQYVFRYAKRNSHYLSEDTKAVALSKLEKGFTTKGVSPATQRKIKKSIFTLFNISEERKVRNIKGIIVSHKVLFVTLTLCATQFHDDSYITKNLLGDFFDKCRKLGIFKNYVWRAEKQQNGNLHYHIVTDTYASKSMISRIWLSILKKYGYLKKYTDKFTNMSLSDYSRLPFNKGFPYIS